MESTSSFNFDDLISFPSTKKIMAGNIVNTNGENVPYFIELGFSKKSLADCNGWKNFTHEIIGEYIEEHLDDKDYEKTLQSKIMTEDLRWNWSKKAFNYNTSEYNWFFLKTEDDITQAVCLTFHPKESTLNKHNIFYIEYIASAPWNRNSLLYNREFKGVGIEIIKQIQRYFKETYHYKYGFSLHSLPQAQEFYEKIGMINYPKYNDKNGLFFYEIAEDKVTILLGETNAGN